MKTFLKKAIGWFVYRISIRAPRLTALIAGEIPTRPVEGVYTYVPPNRNLIPNVVYQTWTVPRFGRTHGREIAAFRARNPDYSFAFYSDADLDAYMAEQYHDHPIHSVYRNVLFGPMKTDIWRYCILYERGGIYCDIGKAIEKPFREFVSPTATAVISWEKRTESPFTPSPRAIERLQHPNRKVINWAMMSAAGHPLLKRVIDGIVANYPEWKGKVVSNPKEAILGFTGPVWLTQCVLAAAESGDLENVVQAGIEFDDSANWGLPGSYVRYIDRPAYVLAREQPIVQ